MGLTHGIEADSSRGLPDFWNVILFYTNITLVSDDATPATKAEINESPGGTRRACLHNGSTRYDHKRDKLSHGSIQTVATTEHSIATESASQ